MATRIWWEDSGNIARLIRHMNEDHDRGGELTMNDVLHILEKPWKWDREFAEMDAAPDEEEKRSA